MLRLPFTALLLLTVLLQLSTATHIDGLFEDKIDYDTIFKKDFLLKPYMDCVMDEGRCTKDGKYLKKALPFIIKTECQYCNVDQKKKLTKLIQKFRKYQPSEFQKLLTKYDPSNIHWNAFEKLVEEYK
uniref:Putative insect pheromone-binding family n=1 Tax=Panstrongylus lignarius TaxID=156445 RepID=A0A224XT57_9HEMI